MTGEATGEGDVEDEHDWGKRRVFLDRARSFWGGKEIEHDDEHEEEGGGRLRGSGGILSSFDDEEMLTLRNWREFLAENRMDGAAPDCADLHFHLHRFDDCDRLVELNLVPHLGD